MEARFYGEGLWMLLDFHWGQFFWEVGALSLDVFGSWVSLWLFMVCVYVEIWERGVGGLLR